MSLHFCFLFCRPALATHSRPESVRCLRFSGRVSLVVHCFGLDSEKFTIMIVVIIVVDIQFGAIIAAFNDSPILWTRAKRLPLDDAMTFLSNVREITA